MNFIACTVAIFPRQLLEVETRYPSHGSVKIWCGRVASLLNLLTQLVITTRRFSVSSPWPGPHTICSSFLCVSGFPCRYEKNSIMTCVVATGLVYLFN